MKDDATAAEDIEDIGVAVREGRPVRPASAYRIAVSDQTLVFRAITVDDPVPLGRQILEAAGYRNIEEYSLFAILTAGDFEEVRLDETFDLRGKGVERFIAFRSDRDFRLTLNGHELRWGEPVISGTALYALGNVPDDEAVYLDSRGGEDRLVEPGDQIDLTQPGAERFVIASLRDHRQHAAADGDREPRHVRADRPTGVPRRARRQRRIFHDLLTRRLDAPDRGIERRRLHPDQERDHLQCHPHRSILIRT